MKIEVTQYDSLRNINIHAYNSSGEEWTKLSEAIKRFIMEYE